MSSFPTAFNRLVIVEGGWVNNKNDRGGATMYGVTEAVARAYGYTGRMQDLPLELAGRIFKSEYWDKLNLDRVSGLSPTIAEELFDTGINCGVVTAGKFLQRALNAFNQRGRFYPDLNVDGGVGNMTINAFTEYMKARRSSAERVMLRALNSLQGEYYISISESRPANEDFTFGWFDNRVVI